MFPHLITYIKDLIKIYDSLKCFLLIKISVGLHHSITFNSLRVFVCVCSDGQENLEPINGI